MGWGSVKPSPAEREAAEREQVRLATERITAEDSRRRDLGSKIVMVLVDKIVAEIVRPGPKPEERECYVMAQELRDIVPDLNALAAKVIEQQEKNSARPA